MKLKSCRNCNHSKLILLFTLGNIAFTGKFPERDRPIKKASITLVMCRKCKLVQLAHNYNLKYLYGLDYGYRTGINKTMTDHMKNVVLNMVKISKINSNDAVLDIASNDGTLLNFYKKDFITFGIDPVLKKYKKNYKKINYHVSDFFNYKLIKKKLKKKFKIITALSVFYDLKNPNVFLKNLEKLIDNDGVILLEFADLASIIKNKMFDTICHEHLEYYSTKVLIQMLRKNSLKLFDIKKNLINGSSKQFLICRDKAKYKVNITKIKKILLEEKKLNLEKKETYVKFKNHIDLLKKKLKNSLLNIKEKKKIVHGYGASTKGNVLLQYFDLDKKQISYIADRNPKKFGLFTPGTRIPIISEKKSRATKPDYYLVLPWHFKNEILKRESKMLDKGTSFIFPLPKFSIVKKR